MLRRGLRGRLGWAFPLALLAGVPACKFLPESCREKDVVDAPPPPPPRPTVSVDEVKALANSGKHEEALAMAEKAVADHPEDDAAWRILEQEAILSGKAGELLDRLDAANPIGGRKVPHQVLRGSLAREAGRPDVMLAAGESLRAEAPAEAAAFLAAAGLKGATVPGASSAVPEIAPDAVPTETANDGAPEPGTDAAPEPGKDAAPEPGDAGGGGEPVATAEATPQPATDEPPAPPTPAGPDADLLGFVRYVTARTNDDAARWKTQADRMHGWRADFVRGQREAERGDAAGAFASFDRAVRVRGSTRRVRRESRARAPLPRPGRRQERRDRAHGGRSGELGLGCGRSRDGGVERDARGGRARRRCHVLPRGAPTLERGRRRRRDLQGAHARRTTRAAGPERDSRTRARRSQQVDSRMRGSPRRRHARSSRRTGSRTRRAKRRGSRAGSRSSSAGRRKRWKPRTDCRARGRWRSRASSS